MNRGSSLRRRSDLPVDCHRLPRRSLPTEPGGAGEARPRERLTATSVVQEPDEGVCNILFSRFDEETCFADDLRDWRGWRRLLAPHTPWPPAAAARTLRRATAWRRRRRPGKASGALRR